MDDISIIYKNKFGIVFVWKRCVIKDLYKINIVFKKTGLHFTLEQLIAFKKDIEEARQRSIHCKDCCEDNSCKPMLLNTPIPQVSFAMNYEELKMIHDLVSGALFELGLAHVLNSHNIK
ncbi:hypothetical protein [uncultured Dokdonia sp.]|uniref:hypothetical protein n=1 Tax=uncultured Dokdonia sp. TaxID=575653 RepID=UPI00262B9DC4|nr:hypothetical protein [uncultured Dokdonia sp.]